MLFWLCERVSLFDTSRGRKPAGRQDARDAAVNRINLVEARYAVFKVDTDFKRNTSTCPIISN